ncbi:MAG: ATP-binding cassette subfamily F protein 3 [Phenylobacterium sp.]|jgi:ATP-binding cassette subfamily F protein 3
MIQLTEIQLFRGTNALLDHTSATIYPKHKVGLVGANGSGKSTLFALLNGVLTLDAGTSTIPKDWVIANVAQETPELDRPALDYVIDGDFEYRAIERKIQVAERDHDGHQIGHQHQLMDAIEGYSIGARAGELLHGLGFTQAQTSQPVKQFSGGWRMRLNLAQALICRSDLLLLDEPTNHLDLDAVLWLESWLKRYQGTLILISHDRDFLDNVINQTIHIEHKKLNSYSGNYTAFERQRIEQLAQQQSMYDKQQKQKAHLQQFVDRFKAKASKAKQAQSRVKALERMEQLAPAHVDSPFDFQFFKPESLPNPLITMENVQLSYGDTTILEKIKLNLVPGSRIGLLGRNGAGKSTLIKLLSGELKPKNGVFDIGQGVKLGYFAQHQLETLDVTHTPLDHMRALDKVALEQKLRDFLGRFGFNGDKALSAVGPFSGGEKARLVLALMVYQKPNLLLLDEPTNHLDLDMRHALSMALQGFAGAMVVVSHDRNLLKTTTDEFYLVDSQRVTSFDGDLEDYYQWLMDTDKRDVVQDDKPLAENSAVNRKDQKRKDAEFRQKTKPLRQKIDQWEKQMDKLNQEKDSIEASLADSSMYEAENKKTLAELLKQQATNTATLNQVEEDWMMAQEELEQLQAND